MVEIIVLIILCIVLIVLFNRIKEINRMIAIHQDRIGEIEYSIRTLKNDYERMVNTK